jgi:hypothetical protein
LCLSNSQYAKPDDAIGEEAVGVKMAKANSKVIDQ